MKTKKTINEEHTISEQEKNTISFLLFIRAHKIKKPVTEHKFLKDRKFRFDFAWPDEKIAVEIEGGIWTGGRHTRGKGYLKDMEKYNLAVLNSWKVLRFSTDQIMKNETYMNIKRLFE